MVTVWTDSKNRSIFLVVASACMVLSDCMSLLGGWAYYLKYMGLVLFMLLGVIQSARQRVEKSVLGFSLAGVSILIAETLFQSFSGVSGMDSEVVFAVLLFLSIFMILSFGSNLVIYSEQLVIIAIAMTLLVSILMVFSANEALSQWRLYVSLGRPRMSGCFSNPNSLGSICAMTLMMLMIGVKLSRLTKHWKNLAKLCALILFVLILLSGSRTAAVMSLAFALVVFLQQITPRLTHSGGFALKMLVVTIVIALFAGSFTYLNDDLTLGMRLDSLWHIFDVEDFRLFGVGYVSSDNVGTLTGEIGGAADMLYVSLYYRVGIIGFVAYLIIAAGPVALAARSNKEQRDMFAAFMVAILLLSVGESYASSTMSYVSCWIWLLAGCIPSLEASRFDNTVTIGRRGTIKPTFKTMRRGLHASAEGEGLH